MSDSDDSDSFLSADEGEGNADAGNVSSDITLSSDSEPEEAGQAATGSHDSSDITLSSDDEDKKHKRPPSKTTSKEAHGSTKSTEDKKPVLAETDDKTKHGSCPEAGTSKNIEQKQKLSSKSEHTSEAHGVMSDVSSALPSDMPTNKPDSSAKSSTEKVPEQQSADCPLEAGKAPQTVTAEPPPVSHISAPASEEKSAAGSQKVPSNQSPIETATESVSQNKPSASSDLGHSSIPDASDGWGDFDDDIVLPDDSADGAEAEEKAPSDGAQMAAQSAQKPTAPHTESLSLPQPASSPPEAPLASESEAKKPQSEPTEGQTPASQPAKAAEAQAPPSEAQAPSPSQPAEARTPPLERRRPERRERRGPLKLGAKKLGTKVTAVPSGDEGPAEAAAAVTAGEGVPKAAEARAAEVAPQSQQSQDGWGGWEAWGSSLLSSAAGVTQTVLETVETGFGAPEPEDLARITRQEQEKRQQQQQQQQHQQQQQQQQQQRQQQQQQQQQAAQDGAASDGGAAGLGLGSWFGGVSRVLGHTSSLVVNTGLDTLEAIGKKTMTVLQDDQLGIHNTITQLGGGQKPSLSQALREARERRGDAVPTASAAGDRAAAAQPATFTHMFDQCDGTVHLEALEMLSTRCRSRVNTTARTRAGDDTDSVLLMIEELCSPEELEPMPDEVADFDGQLATLVSGLGVPIKPTRLIIAQSSACQWLAAAPAGAEGTTPRQVLTRAVRASAEVGAGLAEFLHKLAELWLVEGGSGSGVSGDPAAAARRLARLAALVSARAGELAARFAELLSDQPGERAADATTDIYLQVSYLQKFCTDSLQLMTPVLQMAALSDAS